MRARPLKFIVGFLVAVLGFGLITMLLWNILLPDIFGITTINFWQAIGLLVLTRVLFSGIGGGAPMHSGHKNPIREKWQKMTLKERREFMRKHRHHGGFFGTEELEEEHHEQEDEQS